MLALALAVALAAENQSLVEDVAVKNKLFNVQRRAEVGLSVGFTANSRLTEHYVFDATAAYNVYESLAFEAIGGWAYGRQTSLARQIAASAIPSSLTTDLTDLWRMTGHCLAGVRWQPIYGKLGLFSEALHFQFFAWLGAGGAYFVRDGIVGRPMHQEQAGAVFSAAIGARFFLSVLGDRHALRLEARDFSWLDSYPAGTSTGHGLTNLAQVTVGYTFLF